MKLIYTLLLGIFCFVLKGSAQDIPVPADLGGHPRILTKGQSGKDSLAGLLAKQNWARQVYDDLKKNIDPYVNRHVTDSTWILSRLQMYWQSNATDVFVKNGAYAYSSGKAPVPTVRFTGTRDAVTSYMRPKLEDIKPYMGDNDKLYLQNGALPSKPWEYVDQSKSGRIIESINMEIMQKAQDAAFMYWYTGDEKYGKFAYDIFNTYVQGMYYRNEPVDLNHGHDQTLLGMSAFEVIHEDVLRPLTICYDFLHSYIEKYHSGDISVYDATLKKWADLIIKNGVPYNNWDLYQARFIAFIALVLENNNHYADNRGSQYYLDQIINKTHTRQWSLKYLLKRGYDASTGIWGECPGYSLGVIGDFTQFVTLFDHTLGIDFLSWEPVIGKAVLSTPQYLYPNGYTVAFGDTHYGRISTDPAEQLVLNGRHFNKPEQEVLYTRLIDMLKHVGHTESNSKKKNENRNGGLNSLFAVQSPILNPTAKPAKLEDFATATFYAPNVSYFVQRNGFDVNNGLMISQAGSEGNHAHANGIAMELYGKGIVLAPEGGIGTTYFQSDYAEYYSQFPAHNTVVVDGISSYPTMKSHHPFTLKYCYPASAQKMGYFGGVTFSDADFTEPETNADQDRLMSIIRTGDSTGFYVDIFRSKKKLGGDKNHDYIYHNLGQELLLTDALGEKLDLKPTDKLTFANEELIGYDYWYDKKSIASDKDFKAVFDLKIPGRENILMNMWMKGYPQREIFSVKAPPSRAFRNEMIPQDIADLPLPTVVIRQQGEAWKRPFAAIYEPAIGSRGTSIRNITPFTPTGAADDFVGICVMNKSGMDDYIFSSFEEKECIYKTMKVNADYAAIAVKDNKPGYLFLGKGTKAEFSGYGIEAKTPASGALWFKGETLWFTCYNPVMLTLPDNFSRGKKVTLKMAQMDKTVSIVGTRKNINGCKVISFIMPVTSSTIININ
ncbi:MAG TPA: heparinase II/III family protein [Mucilaginibacter sp.]|jgi:hypothetical protein